MLALGPISQGTETTTTNCTTTVVIPALSPVTFAAVYNADGDTLTSITLDGVANAAHIPRVAHTGELSRGIDFMR